MRSRQMNKPCQTCFSPRADPADIFRKEAERLVATYNWKGSQCVLDNIKNAETIINIRDHLAVLRAAEILSLPGTEWPKPCLEEPCDLHPTRGAHDIILPLGEEQKIVVEVKRFDRATACGDIVEEEITEYVCCHHRPSSNRSLTLKEIKEQPFMKDMVERVLDAVSAKQDQLDPGGINVVWLVSRNIKFPPIEDLAWYYKQPACRFQYPEHLTALGWSFDGSRGSYLDEPYSDHPYCVLLGPCPILEHHMKAVGVSIRLAVDG